MVHRQVIRRACLVLAAALAVALLAPGLADASNRRISISNYRWSDPEIQIDRGEHVTWYWVGPDLMHSVTGTSANALQWDSDPDTNQPLHDPGDSYQVTFDKPGTYRFHCKLHSSVKGEIIVSDKPGDPEVEPDPIPKSLVDTRAPHMRHLKLKSKTISRHGTALKFAINERSKISADFYRIGRKGKRQYKGFSTWKAHVGYNGIRFGGRRKHFHHRRPGRYVARLWATDKANNSTKTKRVHFKINKR